MEIVANKKILIDIARALLVPFYGNDIETTRRSFRSRWPFYIKLFAAATKHLIPISEKLRLSETEFYFTFFHQL